MKHLSVCLLAVAVSAAGPLQAAQNKPAATAAKAAKPAATAKARTVELVGDEKMKFDKDEILAKPGETIRLVLKSVGTMPKAIMAHNFVLLQPTADVAEFNKAAFNARPTDFIPPDKKDDIIAATGLAGAGETVEVTFKVPAKAGSYNFLCSFPGHFAMGMRGKLIVK
jgi:azurin